MDSRDSSAFLIGIRCLKYITAGGVSMFACAALPENLVRKAG